MYKKLLFFILVLLLMPVSRALPWGSAKGWAPTHQAIIREAYKFLSQDPAFQESGFLSFQNIKANEGVTITGDMYLDFSGLGPGPDAENASPYQAHYYNPRISQGKGPTAVKDFYKRLLDPSNHGDKGRSAAWSAHFLADMNVPYHVVGMTRGDAILARNHNVRILPEKVTGPIDLYYSDPNAEFKVPAIPGWGRFDDFWEATVNYVDNHSGGMADWYDPWYTNGYGIWSSHEVGTSSHASWEKTAHKKYENCGYTGIVPSGTGRYNPAWKNAVPNNNFSVNVSEAQSTQAALFAQEVARFTRINILKIHKKAEIGIFNAMRNVATLWRASITGLRPSISYHENVSKNHNEYGFKCHIRNAADAPARNIHVKLFIFHNQKLVYQQTQRGGNIDADSEGSLMFRVKVTPNTTYRIAMAVAAQYDIPDLQYATVSDKFRSNPNKKYEPEPQPEATPNYNCSVPVGAKYFSNEYSEGYLNMINGEEKKVGPYKEWWGDDKKRIKNIECFTKNGGAHGIQTFYKKDGAIGSQYLYNNGYYVKEIKH